jgi:hypothetical protein
MEAFDDLLERQTDSERKSETMALERRGLDRDVALHYVGLSLKKYAITPPAGRIDWIPTPDEIRQRSGMIRSGDVRLNDTSAKAWREIKVAEMLGEREVSDRYETAGTLPEDEADLPPWLYSAGHDA